MFAQLAGGFCAAALVYSLYYDFLFDYKVAHQIIRSSHESFKQAAIFSIYPNSYVSVG